MAVTLKQAIEIAKVKSASSGGIAPHVKYGPFSSGTARMFEFQMKKKAQRRLTGQLNTILIEEQTGESVASNAFPFLPPGDYEVYAFDGSVLVSREEVRRRHEERMRLEREAEALEDDDFGEPVPVVLDPNDPESPLYTG